MEYSMLRHSEISFFFAIDCQHFDQIIWIVSFVMGRCRISDFPFQIQVRCVLFDQMHSLVLLQLFIQPVIERCFRTIIIFEIGQDFIFGGAVVGNNEAVGVDDALIKSINIHFDLIIHLLNYFILSSIAIQPKSSYNLIMSFFDLQKRNADQKSPTKHLGPGQYYANQDAMRREGYAPFGSLSAKKDNKNNGNLVGPGDYNIAQAIIKPSISKYQNKNIVIVKINDEGGHQFKSRTNRFKNVQASPVGPCTYDSANHKRAKSTETFIRPKMVDKIRSINQKYIKQRRQPTLISAPPILTAQDEFQSYNKNQAQKAKGIINWGLNHQERFDLTAKQPFSEQDKQKALSEYANAKKKKLQPSAVFASKSIKSYIETQIYKTNNAFKAELRKMIDYKDEQPGPASYEPNHSKSLDKTPNKFQFFGSTVERFPFPQNEGLIGPGSYKIQTLPEKRSYRQFPISAQKQQRHSYLPKNIENPGPGAYKLKNLFNNSSSEKQMESMFGSHIPRFNYDRLEEQEENQTRLYGNFQMNNYFKQRQKAKQQQLRRERLKIESQPSAIFASNTKRFQAKISDLDIGIYDLTQNDINTRMMKYQKMVKQLEECQLHKPPFLSSNQRFRTEKQEQSGHKDCWCLVKSVEKKMINHESPVFISNQKRIAIFEESNKVPPVGFYDRGQKSMIKDSFNSRFRKKNQNQKKRSNVLQSKSAYITKIKSKPLIVGQ